MATKYDVKVLPSANQDIIDLAEALAAYPKKAERLFQEMKQKLELLEDNPFLWPIYQANAKYRRINLESHALFYTVDEISHEVMICHVYYDKRDIATLLSKELSENKL